MTDGVGQRCWRIFSAENCLREFVSVSLITGCLGVRISCWLLLLFTTLPSCTQTLTEPTLPLSCAESLHAIIFPSSDSYFCSFSYSFSLLLLPSLHSIVSCLLYYASFSSTTLPRSPSSSSDPLEDNHVAQLLRHFSTDLSLGRQLSLDGALAHHLHQCSYHLRLFRNWLISGQDPLEYLHGQPLAPPSKPQPHTLSNHCSRFSWECLFCC